MTTTVDIRTTDQHGRLVLIYHGMAAGIEAALRVVDCNAPAPVNPHVRRRIRRQQGGQLQIGQVNAEIGVYA
ncbi:MAG: hypothetical protein ABSH36_02575 [Solirubrobacteraceae bacterium]